MPEYKILPHKQLSLEKKKTTTTTKKQIHKYKIISQSRTSSILQIQTYLLSQPLLHSAPLSYARSQPLLHSAPLSYARSLPQLTTSAQRPVEGGAREGRRRAGARGRTSLAFWPEAAVRPGCACVPHTCFQNAPSAAGDPRASCCEFLPSGC